MTNKWKWIFLLWHSWRAACWDARMMLHPIERHGDIEVVPLRYRYAEVLRDFHRHNVQHYRRELFPPKPMSREEFWRDIERIQRRQRDQ